MIALQTISAADQLLLEDQIIETLHKGLTDKFHRQRVLVLIPDHTRSLPLPFLFRSLIDILHDTKQLDFMIALGTHPPLGQEHINKLVGITADERSSTFKGVGLLNHEWNTPSEL